MNATHAEIRRALDEVPYPREEAVLHWNTRTPLDSVK